MKFKSFKIKKLKKSDDGKVASFSGYLAVFGNVDSYNDIIMPSAFSKTINDLKQAGKKLVMCWQHDPAKPIGVFNSLEEDDHGLMVDGEINLETQHGAEAYSLMKQGAIDAMSIGYETVNSMTGYYNEDSEEIMSADDEMTGDEMEVNLLKEIKLWEGSLVTFPANDEALVTEVKSLKTEVDVLIERLNNLKASIGSVNATRKGKPEPGNHSDDNEKVLADFKKLNFSWEN